MKLKRSARIALRRNGRCRSCTPPQAENPAKQDSISFLIYQESALLNRNEYGGNDERIKDNKNSM